MKQVGYTRRNTFNEIGLMRKHCTHKPFLVLLITAFLLLQWSATHIHLAGEHEHDGDHHPHALTAHQHQLNSHHADAIDVANDPLFHIDSNKIVELDHTCSQYHGKLGEPIALLPSCTRMPIRQRGLYERIAIAYQLDTYQSYHQYTALRLRAPPVIA